MLGRPGSEPASNPDKVLAMGLLDGRVAVITGAGRGIGKAVAQLFANEGAAVVVNDADIGGDPDEEISPSAEATADAIRAEGGIALSNREDISEPEAADRIAAAAIARFGKVDIWVNNAGITLEATLSRTDPKRWNSVLRTNLDGALWGTRAAARVMRSAGRGSIINTTSTSAWTGQYGAANQAAASAGVHALTLSASIEFRRHSIRVNAIAPMAKTRMTAKLPLFAKVDSLTVAHVAPVYLFLASTLSEELTGQIFSIAGSKISLCRLTESVGAFKETGDGIWTPQELAAQFEQFGEPRPIG